MLSIALSLLLSLQNEEPPVPPPPPGKKGEVMDYGPFFSSTVAKDRSKGDSDILAYKAISVKVGKDATYCFDTDLCRAAGGWTGGFLDLSNTHLVTYKGGKPTGMKGTLAFETKTIPGATTGDTIRDPRPIPHGPLPAEWAHYRGLYVHGDRVVFSYTVGDCAILESPRYLDDGFVRTLTVGKSSKTVRLLSIGAGGAILPKGAQFGALDGNRVVAIPAREFAVHLEMCAAMGVVLPEVPEDPAGLCKGGPARWKPAIVTKGTLGKEPGAYAVDTVTVPEENPWGSWLRFTGLDFFSNGDAAVCTWNGDVWTVSGLDATLEKVTWKRFAAGLYEPLGLKVVEDKVYVRGRDQITRLHDLNGDGEADFYENFNNGGIAMASYHDFAYELQTDRAGNFYYTTTGHRTDTKIPLHGCVLKVTKDGKGPEVVATGLRAPNGLGVGPNDEIVCSDNQGNWCPSSRVNWVKKDGFYGYVPHAGGGREPKSYDPPLLWLPHALDNSSGSQVWAGEKWGPLSGMMLHLSYGTASIFAVTVDRAADPVQGGFWRMPLTFSSGITRARVNPKDGQVWVAGLKGWQTRGARDACLQRIRYTGKPANAIVGMKAAKDGLELTFSDPLDPELAGSTDSYAAEMWNYLWSEKYGSPDISVLDPTKKGRDPVDVKSAKLSADGKSVLLEIPGLRPVMQLLVRIRIAAKDKSPISTDFYCTLNRVP